ncbi:MAG: hypothetical protein KDB53_11495, partial [Planctomycetes bacterium]|nr:hypothetical protein [Planctomycetota bacterium]
MTDFLNASHASLVLAQGEPLIDEGIHFANLPPNYVAWLLIPLGIVAFAWFFYRRERMKSRAVRVLLAGVRAVVLFAVILLIFEPYRQFRRVEEIRSQITVLIDESASMDRHDPYDQDLALAAALRKSAGLPADADLREFSRSELAQRALGPDGTQLLKRCREKHDVSIFGFSTGKPRPIEALSESGRDGPVTATGDAMGQVLSDPEIQTRPDTSLILISDGRTNTGIDPVDLARHSGENERVPIHVIGVGDPAALRDIELRYIRADEVVLKGNTMRMELTARQSGFDDQYVTVSVKDQSGRAWAAARSHRLAPGSDDQLITLDIVVSSPQGSYTLDVTLTGPAGEEDLKNNTKQHTLTVKDDRLRVLYVDTLPRWEYRRLKNYLVRGEDAFDTQCLLLSAEQSFIQEHTRRAGADLGSLREFPTDFAALDAYDVIIFGDVDQTLLASTPEKVRAVLENLKRFVENGGGLAVICGDGWTPISYVDTPLEEVLPVDITTVGDSGPLRNYAEEWKPQLTAFGRMHPIMQIRRDPEDNRMCWERPDYGLKELRWF